MAVTAQVGCNLRKAGCHLTKIILLLVGAVALRADTFYLTIAGLGGEAALDMQRLPWARRLVLSNAVRVLSRTAHRCLIKVAGLRAAQIQ